tara:strand:- start:15417 stop:15668 length:252 start_codon:yes stop_codon:yes gene_type:complete
MTHNIRKHEFIGLLLIFLAGTCISIGLYLITWGANRPIFYNSIDYLIKGKEMLIFPIFFGVGCVLWTLGKIELKEAMPGRRLR